MASILVISFGFAQKIDHYGLKAGLNFAKIVSNDSEEEMISKTITQPFFGVYADKTINEKSYINAEAHLSFLGGRLYLEERGDYVEDYTEKLIQINIPVSYNYFVSQKISIHGGAYVGITISGKETDNISHRTYDIEKNLLDFGFLAGASYKINDKFSAQLRYNFGILDIESKQNTKWMNRFFQMGVSYELK